MLARDEIADFDDVTGMAPLGVDRRFDGILLHVPVRPGNAVVQDFILSAEDFGHVGTLNDSESQNREQQDCNASRSQNHPAFPRSEPACLS